MASVAKREWIYQGKPRAAYVVRWKQGGKHRSQQFARQKEADAFRRKIERELDDGIAIGFENKVTVAQAANLYLKQMEVAVNDGSCGQLHLRGQKTAVDNYLIPALGHKLFNEISWPDLDVLHDRMRAAKLAPASRRKYFKCFRQIEGFCIRRGSAMRPIIRQYVADMKPLSTVPVRVLSVAEMGVLLQSVEVRPSGHQAQSHAAVRCMIHLAAFCGLRFGEIVALQPDRIDLDRGVINIDQSLTMLGEIKKPKTKAGIRQVALPNHLIVMLRDFGEHHARANPDNLLFTTRTGGKLLASNFHAQSWKPMLRRAGLAEKGGDHLHFHSLRHFCASAWIALQMPLPEVAKRIGHSKIDMTLRVYAHAIGEETASPDFADAMSRMLGRGDTQGLLTNQ